MIFDSPKGASLVEAGYRQDLAAWPVPREERVVTTSFGPTFVVISGSEQDPPLVLLHGSSANAVSWAPAIPAWASQRRIYAIDVPGEPGRSAPVRLDLHSEHHRWLGEVLDALGVTTTAMVGESLGGWLAVDWAQRHPERVTELVLLCPGGIGRQRWETILVALLLRVFGLRRSMTWLVGSDAIPESAVTIQRHFRPRMQPLPIVDDATLRRLSMPLLVVLGARDRVFDSAGTRARLATTVEDAEVVVLPKAGHALPRPTDLVLDFLRRHETRR